MVRASHRPCPACAGRRANSAGAENGFLLARCERCRTLYTARLPGPEDAQDYSEYYRAGDLGVPAFVDRRLDALVARMGSHRRTGRWLDVGFGAGALLRAGTRAGWRMTGTEVSRRASEAMSPAGIDVRSGPIGEIELERDSFDVVTALEVVEHLPDPAALFAEARRALRPGGVLYLTTPHGSGLTWRLLGTRWSVVSPPEHLQLFSIAGLRALCSAAGLQQRRVEAHGVNPFELAGALPGRRAARVTARERVAASYRVNEALTRGPARAFAKDVVNRALSAGRLGDSLKFEAQRPHA
jgi:SAM-dependent methyltransferase